MILAGGTAARMDGVDKSAIEVGGRTMLEIALDSVIDADEVVVVGPESVPTTRPVTFVREDPPLGGPVAALLTGADVLLRRAHTLAVLAVDMPRVSHDTFRRLRAATSAEGADGAFLYDGTGRRQLCGVLDAAALHRVRPDLEGQHGMAMHALLASLTLARVEARGDEAADVDTWAELRDLSG